MGTTRVERDYLVVREGVMWKLSTVPDNSLRMKVRCPPYYKFEYLPKHIKEPLSVLLTSPVGYYNERIGRRVTEDVFWVYHE